MTQPNILMIQTDQLSAHTLSSYGDPACQSPHIDWLAETGTVFERAYCNFPLCAPSRFSMAAGLLASKIGAYDNAAEMSASIPTYAHYLNLLGYQTCLSGKMHFVGPDQLHGFEKRLTTDIYPSDFLWSADWDKTTFDGASDTRIVTASGICARSIQIDYDDEVEHKAIQHIYDIAQRKARGEDDRPFFLQASFTHPHDPYLCTQEYWDRYDRIDIPDRAVGDIPPEENDPHSLRILKNHGLDETDVSAEQVATARHAYYGAISYIDDKVGALINALRGAGELDNTIIIFTSDHGEMLGERGLWLKKVFFEPALRIPMIVRVPNQKPARVTTPVSLIDIAPSLIAMGKGVLDTPEPFDGADMLGFIDTPQEDRIIPAELLSEPTPSATFALLQGRYKFLSNNLDPDMLFDLIEDPNEMTNLAEDSNYFDVVAGFKAEIEKRWNRDAIHADITLSQRRRRLINKTYENTQKPIWDYMEDAATDSPYFRGRQGYNDWAFDYLKKK